MTWNVIGRAGRRPTLWVAAAGFLPRYAKYLHDDWCQIAGVRAPVADPAALLRLAGAHQGDLRRMPGVEVYFENVDAAFWRFCANDPALLELIAAHLKSRSDVRIRALSEGGGRRTRG